MRRARAPRRAVAGTAAGAATAKKFALTEFRCAGCGQGIPKRDVQVSLSHGDACGPVLWQRTTRAKTRAMVLRRIARGETG